MLTLQHPYELVMQVGLFLLYLSSFEACSASSEIVL